MFLERFWRICFFSFLFIGIFGFSISAQTSDSSSSLDFTKLIPAKPERHISKNSLVHTFDITFSDGKSLVFDRFEMPKVYLEKGKVVALFLAAKPKGKEDSFSVALPVK